MGSELSQDTTVALPPDPLAGVRAKLDRATDQLDGLHREILAFGESRPYTVTGQFDPDRSSFVFRMNVLKRPPIRWGVLTGEIVHNFRSALDYLVWQLVKLNGQTPGVWNSYPLRRTKPIDGFASLARQRKGRRGPLWGVGKNALAIIERTQPYHGGHLRSLSNLDALSKIDKHRFLMPAFLAVSLRFRLSSQRASTSWWGPFYRNDFPREGRRGGLLDRWAPVCLALRRRSPPCVPALRSDS